MRLILETFVAGLLAVLIVLAFSTVVFAQNIGERTVYVPVVGWTYESF